MAKLKREAEMILAASDLAAVLTEELCRWGLLDGMKVWRIEPEGTGRFKLHLAPRDGVQVPRVQPGARFEPPPDMGEKVGKYPEPVIHPAKRPAAKTLGAAGGEARKAALSPERRSEIARTAAQARWGPERGAGHG